jgi:uncharacterized membrane protein
MLDARPASARGFVARWNFRAHIAATAGPRHRALDYDASLTNNLGWAMLYLLALLIGVIGGLRAMTAPLAVSVAAHFDWLDLSGSWLAFLGYKWTPMILLILAIGELIADQLPSTPSRKVPVQFGTRILVGALTGGAIGVAGGALWIGAVIGVIGAIIGTLGGSAARGKMAAAFGKDRPAALIEDAVAIGGAILIVLALP